MCQYKNDQLLEKKMVENEKEALALYQGLRQGQKSLDDILRKCNVLYHFGYCQYNE